MQCRAPITTGMRIGRLAGMGKPRKSKSINWNCKRAVSAFFIFFAIFSSIIGRGNTNYNIKTESEVEKKGNSNSVLRVPISDVIGNLTDFKISKPIDNNVSSSGSFFALTATISGSTTVCRNDVTYITFNAGGGTAPYTFYYNINGGPMLPATTSGVSSSATITATTSAAGTFNYNLLSVQDGVNSDGVTGTATIVVNPLPTAVVTALQLSACNNATSPTIRITGSGSTAPYSFTYNITTNGVTASNQIVASDGTGIVDLSVPTNVVGTISYQLVSVQSTITSCANSATSSATVTINPNPTFSPVAPPYPIICQGTLSFPVNYNTTNSPNQYNIIWDATALAAGFTNVNELLSTNNLSPSPGSFSVNVPGNVSGIYSGSLVVRVSSTGCMSSITSSSVLINPLPTATISGTTAVCENAASPLVTFTGAGGTSPYTFTYKLNGGADQIITTTSGNSITLSAPTGTPGTLTYTLVSVQDASSTTCSNPQSGTVTVTVNPLPTATINGTTAVCENAASPLITFTGATGTSPYTFTYKLNGGADQIITTTSGNSITLSAPTGTPGTLTYTLVSVQDASSTTCSNTQSGTVTVTVNPLPTATISGTTTVCENAASPLVTFTGATGTSPYTFTYKLNGGADQIITTTSGNSITLSAPTGTPGTLTYALVSVQDASSTTCSNPQTGTVTVTVNPLPTATISGTTTVCENAASPLVTFTGAAGTSPYTFTYKLNGGADQIITTTSGNSITLSAPTGTPGTLTYTLVSVQDASSTTCSNPQSGTVTVTVNPLPTASVSGTTAVCENAASPLVTFTGAVGTSPYTFTYKLNGGPDQIITTTSGNSITLSAPTGTPGTLTYTLVSVQDASSTTCSNLQSGTVTVTVNPLPTAAISGTTAVCENAASPLVTFTGATGTSPYTFTYKLNGGADQIITTTSGNSITLSAPTGTPGTLTYTLVSVQDASSTTCSNPQSGTVTVTVNPLPTASVSGTTTVCENAASPLVTFTSATGTSPYTFTYKLNGGPDQTVSTTSGNSVTLSVPTGTVGTFAYTLVSVQDGSSTTCSNLQSGSATVIVNALPTPTIMPSGSTTFCVGGSVNLTATAASSYLWSTGETTQTVLATTSGGRTVRITDVNGCTATSSPETITVNALPTPTIIPGGSTTFCAGGSVNLTATAANAYLWNTGETTQSVIATTFGGRTVTITDVNGCSATSSPETVTVNALPTPTITPGGSTTFCAGGSVNLTATAANAYLWSTGETTQTVLATTSGGRTVTITDVNGCSATSSPETLTVNALPTPTITPGGSTIFCAGGSVNLTATLASSYLWSTGETTQAVIATTSGGRTVTITDVNGCTATSPSEAITVNALPTPTITPGGSTTFCAGGSVNLTATAANAYLWSTGETTQTVLATTSGGRTVTITDVNGCTATSPSEAITVNALPTPTITPGGSTTFCAGGSVNLTATLASSYLWSTGETTQTVVAATAGNRTVTITDSNGCSATSSPVSVTVNLLPAAIITTSGPTSFCADGSVNLTASSGASWNWSSGETTQSVLVGNTSNKTVTVTDVNGCSNTSTVVPVTVHALPATPVISGNASFCAGGSTVLSSPVANAYAWSTGQTTRTISVTNAGSYSVTVMDANGCQSASAAFPVSVNVIPSVVLVNPPAVCAPATIDLTASSVTAGTTPGVQYTYWTDAAATSILSNPASVNTGGIYYIKATIAATGCSSIKPVTVTIHQQPVLNITNPSPVCVPATINLTAPAIVNGSSSGLSYSYWSDAATTVPVSNPAAISTGGTFYIKGTAASGCTASLPVTAGIGVPPVGTLQSPAVNFVCEGSAIELKTISNASRFQWYKDLAAIVNATAASYQATTSGNYTVQFISSEGCIKEAGNTIALDLVQKPVLRFVSDSRCEGLSTTFTNQSTFASSGGISWVWDFGNGVSSNAFSASHSYRQGGNYTVALTGNNASCPSLTATVQTTVTIEMPRAAIRYSSVEAMAGKEFRLVARSFGVTYLWRPPFGLSDPATASPSGILQRDTSYTVLITTAAGCTTTDTVSVKVSTGTDIYVPKAFTPNGDGQNDRLYPQLAGIQKLVYFRVFNRWGHLVFQTTDPAPVAGWNGKYSGVLQPAGTYVWVAEGIDLTGNSIKRNGNSILLY